MLLKVLALSLISTSSALAAPTVPDCWTTSGEARGLNREGTEIADGSFNVVFDTKQASKKNLLRVMKAVNLGYLRSEAYPIILDDSIILTTNAVTYSALPRESFQRVVGLQLQELAAIPGVKALECNVIDRIPEKRQDVPKEDEGYEDEPKEDEPYQDELKDEEPYEEEATEEELKDEEPYEDEGLIDEALVSEVPGRQLW